MCIGISVKAARRFLVTMSWVYGMNAFILNAMMMMGLLYAARQEDDALHECSHYSAALLSALSCSPAPLFFSSSSSVVTAGHRGDRDARPQRLVIPYLAACHIKGAVCPSQNVSVTEGERGVGGG